MAKQVALIQSTANNSFPRGINFLTVVALDTLSTTADSHGVRFDARVNYYADFLTNEEKAHATVRTAQFVEFALEKLGISRELADKRNTKCESRTLADLPEFASVRELRNYLCNAVTNVKTFTFYKTKVAALEKVFGILAQVAAEAVRLAKEENECKFAKFEYNARAFKINTERHAIWFASKYINDIAQGAEAWGRYNTGFSLLDTELGAAVCSMLARPYNYKYDRSSSANGSLEYDMLHGAYGDDEHYGDGYTAMVRLYKSALNSANCTIQDYEGRSGVYTQAIVALREAFAAAGLEPNKHWRELVIVENELIERVAARVAQAAACYAQAETFDHAVTEAPIAIGRILAAGYGDDLTPYLDPEYLRGRFGKAEAQTEAATAGAQVETITAEATEAQDEAELVAALEQVVASQEAAQVDATAQADTATQDATQNNAKAPEGAAATVKLLARAVAQAVATMGAQAHTSASGAQVDASTADSTEDFQLEPMYLEPEQGWLELSFEDGAQGDTGEAGGAAAPAPAELDWAEVDASDGFVYDPEGGLEFFTIDDEDAECEDAFCARAQGTLERDAWGESYGYLPVYGDALESVLEASTLTSEELAARCAAAGAAVVPVVGQAAKTLKLTELTSGKQLKAGKYFGARVMYVDTRVNGVKTNKRRPVIWSKPTPTQIWQTACRLFQPDFPPCEEEPCRVRLQVPNTTNKPKH